MLSYIRIPVCFGQKSHHFENPSVIIECYLMGCLLYYFLGLNLVRFHYNNISSKGTMIFCSIKLSDTWKLTQYIMHSIETYKVLKNGPK